MEMHLINSSGIKKVLPISEWSKIQSEGREDGFFHDIDWYLNNGYISSPEFKNRLKQIIRAIKTCK